MDAGDIFLKWVFPLLGGIVGLTMFSVPIKAVLRARRERVLGSLNPLPFAAQTANAASWIGYAYILAPKDLQASALIYWPNQIGMMLGLFFTVSCYGLATTKIRDRQLAILLFFAFLIPVIGAIGVMLQLNQRGLQLLWGFTANAILLVYYTAPLSTIITVLRTKSAATLHFPLAIMQIINGGLWFGYGLAIADPFVWVPNAVGACTGVLLTTLILIFKEKKEKTSPGTSEEDGASSTRELRMHGVMSTDEESVLEDQVAGGRKVLGGDSGIEIPVQA
jgi:solute carrier family 50 protein (sugar transporter)